MSRMTAKSRILSFLSKRPGRNTLTVKQARSRFGIVNVAGRVYDLRAEGYPINTIPVRRANGARTGYQYTMVRGAN